MNLGLDIGALSQRSQSVKFQLDGTHRVESSHALSLSIALTAATISIAATINFLGNDVRVILADVFVFSSILVILYIGLMHQRDWLRDTVVRFALWSAIPVLVLSSALIQSLYTYEHLIPWAIVNRYFGMFVLIGYVFVGYLAGSFGAEFVRRKVVLPFLVVLCVTGGVAVAAHFIVGFTLPEGHANIRHVYAWRFEAGSLTSWALEHFHRIQGLMQNPNAFGLLLFPALILVHEPRDAGRPHWGRAKYAVLAGLVIMIAFTSSRSAWIVGAAVFVVAGILRREYGGTVFRLGAVILCAAVIRIAFMGGVDLLMDPEVLASTPEIAGYLPDEKIVPLPAPKPDPAISSRNDESIIDRIGRYVSYVRSESVSHRQVLVARAVELWRAAPLFGVGLGGFLQSGQRPGESYGFTVHSDYLWLLGETGAVRFLLILSLCGFAIWCFWRMHNDAPDASGPIMGITVLAAILLAGSATDAIYQRGPWLVLGIAAGLSLRTHARSTLKSY